MRVRIDREREERRIATGWFARASIPAFCIYLTVHFREGERFLIRHAGLFRQEFFCAPPPPEVTDPDRIQEMLAAGAGQILVGELVDFEQRKLVGAWPDVISADAAEAALRARLDELARHLSRAGGATESSAVYEL